MESAELVCVALSTEQHGVDYLDAALAIVKS